MADKVKFPKLKAKKSKAPKKDVHFEEEEDNEAKEEFKTIKEGGILDVNELIKEIIDKRCEMKELKIDLRDLMLEIKDLEDKLYS